MQNSSQLKSTFNFFTELLYCYKCILGPVQTSNFTCAESNANEQEQ